MVGIPAKSQLRLEICRSLETTSSGGPVGSKALQA